ncbi:MAG: hypothetical protein ACM3QZ_06030 [Solirubrobacterales bacterium]
MSVKPNEKRVVVARNASGAVRAAREGLGVLIVDVIDMSTTLESALEAGASAVLGASPDETRAPVPVDPFRMGQLAAGKAAELGCGIVVIAEPRVGTPEERMKRGSKLLSGIKAGGGVVEIVLPNLGHETPRLYELHGKIVVAVTDTGGVAYDAAYQVTDRVATGTIARTFAHKGEEPARIAAARAIELMRETGGVAIIAASANSLEDVLAAEYIAKLICETPEKWE